MNSSEPLPPTAPTLDQVARAMIEAQIGNLMMELALAKATVQMLESEVARLRAQA